MRQALVRNSAETFATLLFTETGLATAPNEPAVTLASVAASNLTGNLTVPTPIVAGIFCSDEQRALIQKEKDALVTGRGTPTV